MADSNAVSRTWAVALLVIVLALLASACNLTSAPQEPIDLTNVPTSTVPPTRTPFNSAALPTVITRTPVPGGSTSGGQSGAVLPPTAIPFPTSTPLPISIFVLSPGPGNIVAGNVQVIGAAIHPQFLQYQIEFGPDPNPGNLWYPASNIAQSPVLSGLLGIWNTNTPSSPDGLYQIRLRLYLRDGTSLATVVNSIRVQNQVATPVPTATPVTAPRPIAAFTQDRTTGQAPLVVRFTNQSSGEIRRYNWDFGDGSGASDANVTHSFRTPGVYTVRLVVRGPGGESNVSRQINVQSPNAPVAAFTQDVTSGPAPLTVRFNDISSGSITQRSWNFGDGEVMSDPLNLNPQHTFTAVGTYNVILTVTGPGGTSFVTRQITVQNPQIPAPLAALVASPTQGDAPLLVQFDASDSSGQIDSYNWDFGDGQTAQGQVVSHTFTDPGSYEVTLTVVGPGGQASQQTTIEVTQPPNAPTAEISADRVSGDVPLTVQFDASSSSGDIDSYDWDFGDGQADSGAAVSHTFSAAGTYDVVLTVTGPGGSSTASISISATEPIAPPDAAFEAIPASGPAPLAVQFRNLTTGDDLTFQWDFGDGSSSTEREPSNNYDTPGNYTVILTVNGPGGQDSAETAVQVSEEVVVVPPPVASFTANPTSGDAPLSVQFDAITNANIASYDWNFGDGIGTASGPSASYSYLTPGSYTAVLSVTGTDGQQASQQALISVGAAPLPPPVASFTANPTSGDAPLSVQFDAVTNANIASYDWNFGDGIGAASGPSVNYSYLSPGSYTAVLTVMSTDGQQASQQALISVGAAPLPPPVASFTANPTTGDAPLSVQFDAVTNANIASYDWNFGDGIGAASGPSVNYSYLSPGSYTAVLTVTGTDGQQASQQALISVGAAPLPPPVASFTANPTSGDAPLSVQFDAVADANIVSYNWNFGDGIGTASGPSVNYSYLTPGDYTAILTVTGTDGQQASQQALISVGAAPLPPPVASFTANPTSGDAPLSVQFDAVADANIVSYDWNFGDGIGFANGPSVSYLYNDAGDYTVVLTVTSTDGQQDTEETIITVTSAAVTLPIENPLAQIPVLPEIDGQRRSALRTLYENGLNQGKRAVVFAIIGDDQALQAGYLDPFADPGLNPNAPRLQEVIDWYRQVDLGDGRSSFDRQGFAAGSGWRARDVLDAAQSNPNQCAAGETPLDCELRLIQPAVAIISVGYNDVFAGDLDGFRSNLETIIQTLLDNGVIPIVSTVQPIPGSEAQVNELNTAVLDVINSLENGNGPVVLLFNVWGMMHALPNEGLGGDNVTPSVAAAGPGDISPDAASAYGMNARNRNILFLLNDLRAQVFPDAVP